MDIQTLSRFIQGRLQRADEIVQLQDAEDDGWRLELGNTNARFLAGAMAALFAGTVGIHLLFEMLYAFG